MTRSIDPLFDPRLADWLEEDPNTAPDQALDVVLASFPSIKQRRAVRVPWRTTSMSSTMRLGLMAAVVVAATLGGIYFLGSGLNSPVAGPATPTPSVAISPTEPPASTASDATPSSSPMATLPPVGKISFDLPYHSCEHVPGVSAEVPLELGPAFQLKVFDGERLVVEAGLTWLLGGDGNAFYDPPRDLDGDGRVTAYFGGIDGVFPQTGRDTRLDVELSHDGRLVAQGVYECVMLPQ